jgi:hypothetical protein
MRSGHGSGPGCHGSLSALAALVWGVLTLCGAVAVAQPQVACVHPGNPELVARIRGQTRDLQIRLTYVNAQLGTSPTPEQLQALATQHAAQLVVQVSTASDGGHAVLVYDAERRVLRRRNVPAASRKERLSRSAAAETIALIVRGELSDALRARTPDPEPETTTAPSPAAAAGGEATTTGAAGNTGVAASSTPAAPATRGADAKLTQSADERASLPPTAAAPDTPRTRDDGQYTGPSWLAPQGFVLGLGASATYARTDRLFVAALLAVSLRFSHFNLGLSASTSLNDEAQTHTLTIGLREHTASAEIMLRLPLANRLELSAGPGAGVVIHQRRVISTDPSWLLGDDRTHISAALSVRAELRVRLTQHIGTAVRAGLDYMLRPLRFNTATEADPGVSREVSRLNSLAPWATLLLCVDF